jgi:hypothetical protein
LQRIWTRPSPHGGRSLQLELGRLHYPFKISEAMLARLTPERRTIIEPQPQSLVPPGAAG